jgi:hypothetical protein
MCSANSIFSMSSSVNLDGYLRHCSKINSLSEKAILIRNQQKTAHGSAVSASARCPVRLIRLEVALMDFVSCYLSLSSSIFCIGAWHRLLLTNFILLGLLNFLIQISIFNASECVSTIHQNFNTNGPLPFNAFAHLGPLD